jgi:hypothetical protein
VSGLLECGGRPPAQLQQEQEQTSRVFIDPRRGFAQI